MRGLFLLACAGLFVAGDCLSVSGSAGTRESGITSTIDIDTNHELHYVDIESQSRRKNWDVFGLMLMMIHSDCGPGGKVHLPDCPLLQHCQAGKSSDCSKLCNMKTHHGKSGYKEFCSDSSSGSSGSSSSSSSSSASSADAYNGNSTPEGVVSSGNLSVGFEAWMVAVAASVGLAIAAIRMGQRRERADETLPLSGQGGQVRGSVGRRVGVVSDLLNSVLAKGDNGDANGNSSRNSEQVEMAEYQLEDSRTSSYESAVV